MKNMKKQFQDKIRILLKILKGCGVIASFFILLILITIIVLSIVFHTEWKSRITFSPSGTYALQETVDRSNSALVVVHLLDHNMHELDEFKTHASDAMKWAAGWDQNNRIVMYSSDNGDVYVWNILNDKLVLANQDNAAIKRVDELMKDKYGN